MSIQLWGLTFHLYGLIVGISICVGVLVADALLRKQQLPVAKLIPVWLGVFIGGMLGARLYHVVTSWAFYAQNTHLIFAIWNGGISIIGAVLGGAIGGFCGIKYLNRNDSKKLAFNLIDIAALSLPFSQAIGRVGNYVNQELYGLPTTLPWKIWIDQEHRLPGYEQFEFYHPLFAYEILGMISFAGLIWLLYKSGKIKIGSATFGLLYGAWYGCFRGSLEFLRIDKAVINHSSLGFNQVLLFSIGFLCIMLLGHRHFSLRRLSWEISMPVVAVVLLCMALLSGCSPKTIQNWQQKPDRSQLTLAINRQRTTQPLAITVELVNTLQSQKQGLSGRTQIGSDGMLFVFSTRQIQRFWMKEMRFDLDLIWIADKKIVGVTTNVPHPATNMPDAELPIYSSTEEADTVLEVPAGMVERWQLSIGDRYEVTK